MVKEEEKVVKGEKELKIEYRRTGGGGGTGVDQVLDAGSGGKRCGEVAVQCAVCSVQYLVCSVQCLVCSVQCTVCSA